MIEEEFIQKKLEEWSEKTVSSKDHFMEELRLTIEHAISFGEGIGIKKVWGSIK